MSTELAGAPLGSPFWRLWTLATAAGLGDGIRRVAFPLLAATLTRDPLLVSAVAAATTLPWLLVGPLAGVAVDRYDRLRLLWMTNLARAVVIAVLAVALASGHASIQLLVLAALLVGAGETFVDDAAQALVPRVVARHQLEVANSRLYGAQVVTEQFVGQGITGVLFAAAVVAPFVADAAMLVLASAVAVALARGAARSNGPAAEGRRPSAGTGGPRAAAGVYASIAEGARWLLTQPLLRSLWVMLAALGFASGAFWGVIALYAFEVLRLGPGAVGLVLAVGAAGSLTGSAAAPAIARRLGAVGAMYLGLTMVIAAAVGLALTRSGVIAAALMVVNGFGVLVWNVVGVSLRQRLIPDVLLGRVSAAFSTVAVGGASLGALGAGLVATAAGLPAVFWASAAVITTTAVVTGPTVLRASAR